MSNVTPIYSAFQNKRLKRPLFISRIPAGFPSAVDETIDRKLDLNEYLIKKPAATFFLKVEGHSMKEAGIQDGDLLIVDRSLAAQHRSIVVAVLNGEFTVKRLLKEGGRIFLKPENPDFKQIEVTHEAEFEIWGVIAHVIHSFRS